jgi:hypothetical protein
VISLFLIGTGLAGRGASQSGKIEVLPSSSFAADHVDVAYINRRPHLQYSLTNISSDVVPALMVRLAAYDAKGNLRGRQTWVTENSLPTGSKVNSILAMTLDFETTANMIVEFVPVDPLQSGCGENFCNECSREARESCAKKVQSVDCTVGSVCSCSYQCRAAILLP